MTEETVSTLLKPGEKYRPDATFDHTNRMSWCQLADEETRKVITWLGLGSTWNFY